MSVGWTAPSSSNDTHRGNSPADPGGMAWNYKDKLAPDARRQLNRHQPKPRRSSLQNLRRAVLLYGRLETIPTTNSAFSPTPVDLKRGIWSQRCPHSYSLFVEHKSLSELLAISIGAFGSRGHRLAAVRDHSANRGVIQ